MDVAGLFFDEPGVKVNGKYYRDVLLSHQMLPAIRYVGWQFCLSAGQLIGRVTQSNSCSVKQLICVKQLISVLQSYGLQQSRSEPRWLQDLGSHAAVYVRDADPQFRWTQAVTAWRLKRSAAKCCRHCCKRVQKAFAGVTLQTSAVGCFDNGMILSIDSLCTMCFVMFLIK